MKKPLPSLPSTKKLEELYRIITSKRLHRPKLTQPVSRTRIVPSPEPAKPKDVRLEPEKRRLKMEDNNSSSSEIRERLPLALVVNDCVRRWFQDTLKEAKAGDISMQVLVGQMYNSGYGVTKNAQKGRAWYYRASEMRSSVWKVGDKRPGYNASDSDSDDTKADAK